MFRTDVDEVDVHAVDRGRELRERVQLRFEFPPVVVGSPVAQEALESLELSALRPVGYGFLVRPPRRLDPLAEIFERRVRDMDFEWADAHVAGCRVLLHGCGGRL